MKNKARRRFCCLICASLLGLVGCQKHDAVDATARAAGYSDVPCYEPEDCRSRIKLSTNKKLPIYRSHPLNGPNGDPVRAVIVIHGISRNADGYYAYAVEAAETPQPGEQMSRDCLNDTVIVAPHFQKFSDPVESDEYRWSEQGWVQGNKSVDPFKRLSSFAAIDELYEKIEQSFPNVSRITLVGHSAGGQFTNRYTGGGIAPGRVRADTAFAVMNPSSYLYIDNRRPAKGCPVSADDFAPYEAKLCKYNNYRYGLKGLNDYMRDIGKNTIRQNFFDREAHYFAGTCDVQCNNVDKCDLTCRAMAQGSNRYRRALNYFAYIKLFPEWEDNSSLHEVPGVRHSGRGMIRSTEVRDVLFPLLGPRAGVGGYNLCRPADRAVALDYNGAAGDDLFFYRPSLGAAGLLRWDSANDTFAADYLEGGYILEVRKAKGGQTTGISGYDLLEAQDRAVALDYDADGDDDLLLYRPGKETVWLLTSRADGTFNADHLSIAQFGGYDLKSLADRAVALDYDGDGKDDLFMYRPGAGIAWLLTSRGDKTFKGDDLSAEGDGVAGYDLSSADDRAAALDYDGNGKDDLLLYRPGKGIVWLLTSAGDGTFQGSHLSIKAFGGYDLASIDDRAEVLDYNGDRIDDLLMYRPGTGIVWLLTSRGDKTFSGLDLPGDGVGGYDLASPMDRALAFDYDRDGDDDLLMYRPGRGVVWLLTSQGDSTFTGRHIGG